MTTLGLAVGAVDMGVLFDHIGTRETLVTVGVLITVDALLRILRSRGTRPERIEEVPATGGDGMARGNRVRGSESSEGNWARLVWALDGREQDLRTIQDGAVTDIPNSRAAFDMRVS